MKNIHGFKGISNQEQRLPGMFRCVCLFSSLLDGTQSLGYAGQVLYQRATSFDVKKKKLTIFKTLSFSSIASISDHIG